MSDLTLILLAAGSSSRFKVPAKKQWLRIGHDPLWHFVTNRIIAMASFTDVIVVAHPDEVAFMQRLTDARIIGGGSTRQGSLRNAMEHVTTSHVLVSDVARACIQSDLIMRLMENKDQADCIVPGLNVHDTIVYETETINRDAVKRIQTPQLSRTEILKKALDTSVEYTDESSAIVACGGTRYFVEGDPQADKITRIDDLASLECLQGPSTQGFTGNGFDVHPFEENKPMVLAGVPIDSPVGFKAHSDGDVAIHALIDALLGAACLGDIGMLFPDSDQQYKNIDSTLLLQKCVQMLHHFGYVITHADVTIIAQEPRISPYKDQMRQTLANFLQLSPARMNVKATTTEHLGFVGRKEGVAVIATASLHYFDWKNG